MRKSADRQRKRQSRAAAPKHPADPPRDLGSEPPRWSSSSRALVLPRSTACGGSTLDRSYSNCNDGATSTDSIPILSAEPGAHRRTFLQAVAIPPGAKQSFLHHVFGVRQGAEHAVTVDQQLAAMTLDVFSERVHHV